MARIVVTVAGTTVIVSNGDVVVIRIPGGGDVNIEAAPGGNVDNFRIRFVGDDHSDTANVDLSTFSEDGLRIRIKAYDPSDVINLNGATDLTVDPGSTDEMDFEYIGSDGGSYTGYVEATDNGEDDFTAEPSPIVICFTPGAMLTTPKGQVLVEDLRVGDLVITADNGLQPIRWIGRKRMTGARLLAYPELRPIRICKGAFGEDRPVSDIWVSPQHRILLSSRRTLIEHGEREVLASAKGLLNDISVTVDYGVRSTEYIHILFDEHEIVFANGIATESFHPGSMAISAIEENSRNELFDIFPELQNDTTTYGPAARLTIRPQEARLIYPNSAELRAN